MYIRAKRLYDTTQLGLTHFYEVLTRMSITKLFKFSTVHHQIFLKLHG